MVKRPRRSWRYPRLLLHEVVVPGLDPAHDGLRIAHLTDLHVGIMTPDRHIRHAVEQAEAARPDLVLFTGDYLCYSPRFASRFQALTAGLSAPVYATLGNHDHWTSAGAVEGALRKNGYAVLSNDHSTIHMKGAPLSVVGVDDLVSGHADVERAFSGAPQSGSRIVLTHVPSLADRCAAYGPSLILAGHTHGGHINIPRLTARIAERFLKINYLAGFFPVADSLLYVNRGIGTSSVPFRANAPAEVSVMTLRAPQAEVAPAAL